MNVQEEESWNGNNKNNVFTRSTAASAAPDSAQDYLSETLESSNMRKPLDDMNPFVADDMNHTLKKDKTVGSSSKRKKESKKICCSPSSPPKSKSSSSSRRAKMTAPTTPLSSPPLVEVEKSKADPLDFPGSPSPTEQRAGGRTVSRSGGRRHLDAHLSNGRSSTGVTSAVKSPARDQRSGAATVTSSSCLTMVHWQRVKSPQSTSAASASSPVRAITRAKSMDRDLPQGPPLVQPSNEKRESQTTTASTAMIWTPRRGKKTNTSRVAMSMNWERIKAPDLNPLIINSPARVTPESSRKISRAKSMDHDRKGMMAMPPAPFVDDDSFDPVIPVKQKLTADDNILAVEEKLTVTHTNKVAPTPSNQEEDAPLEETFTVVTWRRVNASKEASAFSPNSSLRERRRRILSIRSPGNHATTPLVNSSNVPSDASSAGMTTSSSEAEAYTNERNLTRATLTRKSNFTDEVSFQSSAFPRQNRGVRQDGSLVVLDAAGAVPPSLRGKASKRETPSSIPNADESSASSGIHISKRMVSRSRSVDEVIPVSPPSNTDQSNMKSNNNSLNYSLLSEESESAPIQPRRRLKVVSKQEVGGSNTVSGPSKRRVSRSRSADEFPLYSPPENHLPTEAHSETINTYSPMRAGANSAQTSSLSISSNEKYEEDTTSFKNKAIKEISQPQGDPDAATIFCSPEPAKKDDGARCASSPFFPSFASARKRSSKNRKTLPVVAIDWERAPSSSAIRNSLILKPPLDHSSNPMQKIPSEIAPSGAESLFNKATLADIASSETDQKLKRRQLSECFKDDLTESQVFSICIDAIESGQESSTVPDSVTTGQGSSTFHDSVCAREEEGQFENKLDSQQASKQTRQRRVSRRSSDIPTRRSSLSSRLREESAPVPPRRSHTGEGSGSRQTASRRHSTSMTQPVQSALILFESPKQLHRRKRAGSRLLSEADKQKLKEKVAEEAAAKAKKTSRKSGSVPRPPTPPKARHVLPKAAHTASSLLKSCSESVDSSSCGENSNIASGSASSGSKRRSSAGKYECLKIEPKIQNEKDSCEVGSHKQLSITDDEGSVTSGVGVTDTHAWWPAENEATSGQQITLSKQDIFNKSHEELNPFDDFSVGTDTWKQPVK